MQAQARAGERVDRRRYMGWWLVDGQGRPGLSVFEYAPAGHWTGVTVFAPHDRPGQQAAVDYMQDQRTGERVWPKKQPPGAASPGGGLMLLGVLAALAHQ